MAAPFAVLFISSPHRRGRRPVELPEGAVEELLIGKSVFFHDVGDGLLCVHQVLVDVGDAYLVQVPEEGHPSFRARICAILPENTVPSRPPVLSGRRDPLPPGAFPASGGSPRMVPDRWKTRALAPWLRAPSDQNPPRLYRKN